MAYTFDFSTWVARFPEFAASADQGYVTQLAIEAALLIDVGVDSPIPQPYQGPIFNLAVAHLYSIAGAEGANTGGPVGRLSSVSEGSVSLSMDAGSPETLTEAYWLQTQYGAQLLAMTNRFRQRFRYYPGFPRNRCSTYRLNPMP